MELDDKCQMLERTLRSALADLERTKDVDGIGLLHNVLSAFQRQLRFTAVRMFLSGKDMDPDYHRLARYAENFGVTKQAFHSWVQDHRPNEPV